MPWENYEMFQFQEDIDNSPIMLSSKVWAASHESSTIRKAQRLASWYRQTESLFVPTLEVENTITCTRCHNFASCSSFRDCNPYMSRHWLVAPICRKTLEKTLPPHCPSPSQSKSDDCCPEDQSELDSQTSWYSLPSCTAMGHSGIAAMISVGCTNLDQDCRSHRHNDPRL